MEHSLDTSNSISKNFEFKYIPQKEFDKIVMKVRERRAEHSWQKFCSISSGGLNDDDVDFCHSPTFPNSQNMSEHEIQSVITKMNTKSPSLFAPSQVYNVQKLKIEENSIDSSIHNDDVVDIIDSSQLKDEGDKTKIAEKNDARKRSFSPLALDFQDDDVDDEDYDGGNLEAEMLKLLEEIENSDSNAAKDDNEDENDCDDDADAMVDLTFNEEKLLRNIMDRTEEKVICEEYKQTIDKKKFDFLFDEFKAKDYNVDDDFQAYPVVELKNKSKHKSDVRWNNDGEEHKDDTSIDNNVWNPTMPNQIKKNGRHEDVKNSKAAGGKDGKSTTMRNDDYCDVLPSDVVSRKAQNVGIKLKQDANEKSHVGVKHHQKVNQQQQKNHPKMKDENFNSEVAIIALGRTRECLNKISQYLDYVHEICKHPPELEDMNDLRKRQKRSSEFSKRFARVHLYQISRIGEELRLMPDNPLEIATKVNALFQEIMQTVQTYLRNVEMFIYNSSPDKLSVLIDFIVNATRICLDKLVFDKSDLTIRDLLQKCSMLRKFLLMNQHTPAKFVSMVEKQKFLLNAKNSYIYGVGSKMSIQMTKQKTSPYDPVLSKPRNLKFSTSNSQVSSRYLKASNRNSNSTKLKRSSSNVSTMMSRLKDDDSEDELEIMKMLKKISQEKLEEMLKPIIKEMIPLKNIDRGNRVTSDIDTLKVEKNRITSTSSEDFLGNEEKVKEEALRERLNYIQQMKENPLYVNQTIPEPWQLFARIADNLLEEMLDEVINELDFGEKSFVENFLKSELQC